MIAKLLFALKVLVIVWIVVTVLFIVYALNVTGSQTSDRLEEAERKHAEASDKDDTA